MRVLGVQPMPRQCLLAAMGIRPVFAKMVCLGWQGHARLAQSTPTRSQEATNLEITAVAILAMLNQAPLLTSSVCAVHGTLLPIQAKQALVLALQALKAMESRI